jgi:hypothetical protein
MPLSSDYEALRERNIARNNHMLTTLGLTAPLTHSLSGTITNTAKRKRSRVEPSVPISDNNSDNSDNNSVPISDNNRDNNSNRRVSKRLQNLKEGITSSGGLFVDQLGGVGEREKSRARSLRKSSSTVNKKYGRVISEDDSGGYLSTHISKVLSEEGWDSTGVTCKWDTKRVHPHLTLSKSQHTVVTTGCAGDALINDMCEINMLIDYKICCVCVCVCVCYRIWWCTGLWGCMRHS